jgi:hypothetical protein
MKSIITKIIIVTIILTQFSCNDEPKPNQLTEIEIGKPYNVKLALNDYESFLGLYEPYNEEFDATLISMDDNNISIPVKGTYIDGDNIYRTQEELDKKQDERFPIRIKGSSVLDEMAIDLKILIPNDQNLIGKSFNLQFKDSVIRFYSDNPRSSRPKLYEKIAVYSADLPVKIIEKKDE